MTLRSEKIASQILPQVAKFIKEEASIQDGIVTVVGVDAAADMKNATVWVGIIADGPEQVEVVLEQLKTLEKRVSAYVAAQSTARYSPRIQFRLDETAISAQHIHSLLEEETR